MTPEIESPTGGSSHPRLTRGMVALFAFCCAAIVANLYYAQPIIALIAPAIHMSAGTASLIVSLTQVGYALGMFFLVPLGDLVENRRLMMTTALISVGALAAASTAHHTTTFLLVSLVLGFSTGRRSLRACWRNRRDFCANRRKARRCRPRQNRNVHRIGGRHTIFRSKPDFSESWGRRPRCDRRRA